VLGGTFFVQDGINRNFGFGIYDGAPMTWADAGGYLPAQVTTFRISGATVSITEFADKVVLGGDSYVAVYSGCRRQRTAHVVVADPAPSAGLVALNTALTPSRPMGRPSMITWWRVDRFGNDYPWPTAAMLDSAGSFARHFSHMKSFWNDNWPGSPPSRSRCIARRRLPQRIHLHRDRPQRERPEHRRQRLRIRVQPRRRRHPGQPLHPGDYANAHALLLEARNVVGSQGQYEDGTGRTHGPGPSTS